MNLTCWTIAETDKVLSAFPMESLQRVPLWIAGAVLTHAHSLKSDPSNFAACLNEAAQLSGDGLIVTLPPDLITLDPQWQTRLVNAADSFPAGRFLYGDYALRDVSGDKHVAVRRDLGDITERED